MGNGVKKLISLLTALVMLSSLAVLPASAQDGGTDGPAEAAENASGADAGAGSETDAENASSDEAETGAGTDTETGAETAGENGDEADAENGGDARTAVNGVRVREPRVFEYGTPLEDIVELSGGASLNEPGKVYDAGTYSEIELSDGTKAPAAFTIEPAVVTSFIDEDEEIAGNGVWIVVDADKVGYNSLTTLGFLLSSQEKGKPTFTAAYGDGNKVKLIATWKPDRNNPGFALKGYLDSDGYADSVWHSYTANLTVSGNKIENFRLDLPVVPKAYIRIRPVKAVQLLNPESVTVTVDAVNALPDGDAMAIAAALDLPTSAKIEKVPAKDRPAAKEIGNTPVTVDYAQLTAAGSPARLSAGQSREESCDITDWKIGGAPLTLEALKKAAEEARTSGNDVELKLTPVCDGYKCPQNVTMPDGQFTLIITDKQVPKDVTVTPPADITYGDTLGDPTISGIDSAGITWQYMREDGTVCDGKPSEAGKYRVIAILNSGTRSGRWASEDFFTISPKSVTVDVESITVEPREYDGAYDAKLNTEEVKIDGKLEGDDLSVFAYGSFGSKNANDEANDKESGLKIKLILTGADKDNYSLSTGNLSKSGVKDKITPKVLTLDTGAVAMAKKHDGDTSVQLKGNLKLKGVVKGEDTEEDEIRIDPGAAITASYDSADAGRDKTITLSGIKLVATNPPAAAQPAADGENGGSESGEGEDEEEDPSKAILANYILWDKTTAPEPDTEYTFTLTGAEITDKDIPEPGDDFTVKLPGAADYDGQPHEAAVNVTAEGLGEPEITYAKRNADGGYDEPAETAPVDAGSYKVTVSFTGSDGFAARTFEFGPLTIYRADCQDELKADITMSPGETKELTPAELLELCALPEAEAASARIKKSDRIFTGSALAYGSIDAGNGTVSLTALDKSYGRTQSFDLLLESGNYSSLSVKVTVTVSALEFVLPAATVKEPGTFPFGTPLKDIIELSGGSAAMNGAEVPGTFDLKEPERCYSVGSHENELIGVVFNSADGSYVNYPVSGVTAGFTVIESGGGEEIDIDKAEEVFFTIYANSEYNKSAETLTAFAGEKKPTHNGQPAVWKAAAGNPEFKPGGYVENVWYSYTASVAGSAVRPRAYVRVIPVNADPTLSGGSSDTLKAADVRALESLEQLGLPETLSVAYTPAETPEEAGKFTEPDAEYHITGWTMDGRELTLTLLKDRASKAASRDVELTLIPVYDGLPSWATLTAVPAFKLTVTPRIPVDVVWDGPTPSTITYGAALTLGTPLQSAKGGGGTDPAGAWDFVYYKADGLTRLDAQPKDAGMYKVRAVLNSATHSGTSDIKVFTITPRDISGFTFTPPEGMSLTYNKQPHTPAYTVTDGGKTLKKVLDYSVEYINNTDAGTATVRFTGRGNYGGTKELTFEIAKLALTAAQKPAVSGSAKAGEVLSASLDGVDAGELEWLWTVDGAEAGDRTASFEVKPEHSNKSIAVTAMAKDGGNYSGVSGVSDSRTAERFRVTGAVTITAAGTGDGRVVPGTVLNAAAAVSPEAAAEGGSWAWKVNGALKAGETGASYAVADGDTTISAVFTPNENYSGAVESASIEAGKVLLTGTLTLVKDTEAAAVGTKLTASVSGGPALEEGKAFIYVWLRDGSRISGASGAEYTLTAEDRGRTVSVKATAAGYTGELVSGGIAVPASEPGAPIVTVRPEDGRLAIGWAAADNGGAPVTGYILAVTQGETPVLPETALAANVKSYTLENLKNGTEYTISVIAVNSAGRGEPGTATGTPSAPGNAGGGGFAGGGGGGTGGAGAGTPTEKDESTVTVETLEDGTEVTTITDGRGNEIRTVKKPDGSIVSTVHHIDGCNGTIETDTDGKTIAVVDVPSTVAAAAAGGGDAVPLPVVRIWAEKDIDKAPAMVVNTFGVNGVKVSIPVENKSLTVVAVEIKSDGTPVIIKNTIPTEDGIMLWMNDGEVIRFLDNSKSFADTQGHWATDAIGFVSSRELFNGTAPDIFSPDASMTRGMLVTVLARYENADTEGGATWYEKGAAWAMANGLSDGSDLDGSITREQLAAIIYRYARLKGKLGSVDASLSGYSDAGLVSDWAADAMKWAVGTGLINGTTPTTLDPRGNATRAQVSAIIMRYAQMFGL